MACPRGVAGILHSYPGAARAAEDWERRKPLRAVKFDSIARLGRSVRRKTLEIRFLAQIERNRGVGFEGGEDSPATGAERRSRRKCDGDLSRAATPRDKVSLGAIRTLAAKASACV